MSKVTAKVKLNSKVELISGGDRQVSLSFNADYADARNKEWSLYTPNLSLNMTVNGDVADLFDVSDAFTLTFEKEDPDVGNSPA